MTDSSGRAASPAGRRATALVTGLLTLGLFLLQAPVAASAHDGLVGSVPAPGAAVPTAPASVNLEFSGPPVPLGTQVLVTGPDGVEVSQGSADVRGTTVVQPLAGSLPEGDYTVRWRSTSADGHPVTGSWSFTVAAGSGRSAAAVAEVPAQPMAAGQPTDEGAPVGLLAAGVLGLGAAGLVLRHRLRGRA